MLIPEQVKKAVAANVNAAAVAEADKRRWCEAVAYARNQKRHALRDEAARIDMDEQATWMARRPAMTKAKAKAWAEMYCRRNDGYRCALWVRIHTKLTNYERYNQ